MKTTTALPSISSASLTSVTGGAAWQQQNQWGASGGWAGGNTWTKPSQGGAWSQGWQGGAQTGNWSAK